MSTVTVGSRASLAHAGPWWWRYTRRPDAPATRAARPWWAAMSAHPVTVHGRAGVVAAVTAFTVAVVAAFGWVAFGNPPAEVTVTPSGNRYTPGLEELINGCSGRLEVTDTVGMPDAVIAATLPDGTPYRPASPGADIPVRGFMHAAGSDISGFTTRPANPWSVLRDLWDGKVAVYYAPTLSRKRIDVLQSFATEQTDVDVIVTPWDTDNGSGGFTPQRGIAITGWGSVEYCGAPSYPVIREFARTVTPNAPGRDGAEPPRYRPDGSGQVRLGEHTPEES